MSKPWRGFAEEAALLAGGDLQVDRWCTAHKDHADEDCLKTDCQLCCETALRRAYVAGMAAAKDELVTALVDHRHKWTPSEVSVVGVVGERIRKALERVERWRVL